MNLTFPMALDYRRGNEARAPWPPDCLAANSALWQAGNGRHPARSCLTDPGAERNPMILSLFRKNVAPEPVYAVYNSIVAQSRQPVFYAEWGVPDTVTGRFDMISLHMALLFRRLRHEPQKAKDFSQAVFDLFFRDMDRSLREMGAGDLAVPKKIQKMGNIFFGLLAALNEALDRNDGNALQQVIARNIYEVPQPEHVETLSRYLMARDAELATKSAASIMGGELHFEAAA
jgi:cytochrome b pre-mRNA-processing protein 3